MKYTAEQLHTTSDFDVNLALAKLVCKTHITYTKGHGEMVCADNEKVDYCNVPNDIMPLQDKHHICVVGQDGEWCAFLFDNEEMEFGDKKLCRAITCCLILVLQEQKQ